MVTSQQLAQTLLRMGSEHPNNTKKVVQEFVAYLEAHHMIGMLPNIMRYLEHERARLMKKDAFHITSAYPLTATMVNNILKSFGSGSGVHVSKEHDESLIGGVVIKHDGYMYDTSLKGQLDRLRATLQI